MDVGLNIRSFQTGAHLRTPPSCVRSWIEALCSREPERNRLRSPRRREIDAKATQPIMPCPNCNITPLLKFYHIKLCQQLLNNSVSEPLRQPRSFKCKRLHACQIASEAEWLSSSWENNDCGRASAAEWLSGRGPSLRGVGFE